MLSNSDEVVAFVARPTVRRPAAPVYAQTEPRSATAGSVAAVCFGVSLTVPTTFSASAFVTSVQGSVVLDALAPDDEGAAELTLVEALGLELARAAAVADESAPEPDVEAPQAAASVRERSDANTFFFMRHTGARSVPARWHHIRTSGGMPEIRTTMARSTRRRLGIALIAYGIAGVLLLGVSALIADAALQRLSVADPAGSAFADASAALGDTANAFAGVGVSLADAERAVAQASTSARNASATSTRLSDGMSLSIFGAQPFLALAQDFRRNAADLAAMADGLETLATSLKANQTDVAKIKNDLAILRVRLEAARTPGIPIDALRALVMLLVLWLVLPALAAVGGGAWLLRSARRRAA